MILYYLYSSDGCHLCEQAYSLCLSLLNQSSIKVIDIVDEAYLVEEYGVHIPVLKNIESGQQLFWPFTAEDIQKFAR